jgi:hypothetical protein
MSQETMDSLKNTIFESMKKLHSTNPEEANVVATQLSTQYNIKVGIEVYMNEIKKKSSRLEASEYIEFLTSLGKVTPQNGGILFEVYEEHTRGFRHIDKADKSGDSIDDKTGLHYEIKYCENDTNNAMFHHVKPQDNIDFFIFAYRNTKKKTLTYYRDIPMEVIIDLIRFKEWREKNKTADESDYDGFECEIKTNVFSVRVNNESRASSINKHNYEMLKEYIVDSS